MNLRRGLLARHHAPENIGEDAGDRSDELDRTHRQDALDGDLELGWIERAMAVAAHLQQGGGKADEGEEQADGEEDAAQGSRPFYIAVAGQIADRKEGGRIGVAFRLAVLEFNAG